MEPALRAERADLVLRIVAAVLTALIGVPYLVLVSAVLSSRFGGSFDPHGYVLIFGTMAAVVLGLGLLVFVPLIFPSRMRSRAYGIAAIAWIVVSAGLVAAWFTA
ncbi:MULTISPECIES: hypothetical protein [unclassified Microbacterium]|uniref:hypothetical protein n=1 Tax=unclassified Microbacterium TaxID=2609290 RepID=UPI00097EFF29|nr:hypothetical protein [Microbacterium sp. JB110]RCS61402.1 hypothetical protein CIK77_07775 [Microbacterium sp. JB110]SJM50043.1 hypothetical protein CZ774_04370 [Frigoribacterium sp. JB110]